jgi:hypothetical protein
VRSNCLIWALKEYARREVVWLRAGAQWGYEPKLSFRRSRHRPRQIWHVTVQQYEAGRMVGEWGFVPLKPIDGSIWVAWTRIRYEGRVVEGDEPESMNTEGN